jgi:hypothetical protein
MVNRKNIINSLPQPVGNSILIEENQTVPEIMSLIVYMHKKNSAYYDSIAPRFWGRDLYSTCENLFEFCKDNIPYTVETEEVQTVKSPQRILSDAEIGMGHDCKHYASFIAGVLDALKRSGKSLDWSYRFASYKIWDKIPGHVFCVARDNQGEIWIDPVLDNFDERKQPTYSVDRRVVSSLGYVPGKIGGNTGAVVKDVGGTICAIAPTVALVIPVGTVVAGAIELVGGIVSIIGGLIHDWKNSTQVRWLTQKYQKYVLSQDVQSDNHVNEAYVSTAQAWFSIALGVPMYDGLRLAALRGDKYLGKGTGIVPVLITPTIDQRINNYYAFGATEQRAPRATVELACKIAATMDETQAPGAWKNYPPANIIIQKNGQTANEAAATAAPLLSLPLISGIPILPIALAAGGLYYFLK